MTKQNLEIRCSDALDSYVYVLFDGEKIARTEYHDLIYNYGVVTLKNGSASMILKESHADANKLYDPENPNEHIVTVNHIDQ